MRYHHTVYPAPHIANVRLHAKIPSITLLLLHLRVPLPVPVLRRTRRIEMLASTIVPALNSNPRSDSAGCRNNCSVNRCCSRKCRNRIVLSVLTPNPPPQTDARLHVVQAVFHPRITQSIPLLQKINPQHHRRRNGMPALAGSRILLHYRLEGQYRLHLPKKPLTGRLLLMRPGPKNSFVSWVFPSWFTFAYDLIIWRLDQSFLR